MLKHPILECVADAKFANVQVSSTIGEPNSEGVHTIGKLARCAVEWLQREAMELSSWVVKLRTAIAKHRDMKGDDRCFLDDYELYRALEEPIPDSACQLESPEAMLARCHHFAHKRHDPSKPYLSPQKEIDELHSEVERLNEEMSSHAAAHNEEVNRLKETLRLQTSTIGVMERREQGAKDVVRALRQVLDQKMAALAERHEVIEQLKAGGNVLAKACSEQYEEIKRLKHQAALREEAVVNARKQWEKGDEEIRNLRKGMASRALDISNLAKERDTYKAERDNAQANERQYKTLVDYRDEQLSIAKAIDQQREALLAEKEKTIASLMEERCKVNLRDKPYPQPTISELRNTYLKVMTAKKTVASIFDSAGSYSNGYAEWLEALLTFRYETVNDPRGRGEIYTDARWQIPAGQRTDAAGLSALAKETQRMMDQEALSQRKAKDDWAAAQSPERTILDGWQFDKSRRGDIAITPPVGGRVYQVPSSLADYIKRALQEGRDWRDHAEGKVQKG